MSRHSKIKRGKYITVMKARNEVKTGGRSLACGAVTAQRRDDLEPKVGLTREEFDAIRREEEQLNLQKLRDLKKAHEEHEREVRIYELHQRIAKDTQYCGTLQLDGEPTCDNPLPRED